jgi:YhcH/YjgK/YiaL family protein
MAKITNESEKESRDSIWGTELSCKPDESINLVQLVAQNKLNEMAWQATFRFFKENDLTQLPIGRYELTEDGLTYANVSEYEAKEPEATRYEAHRKYIDLQYVISGEEGMEILPLSVGTEGDEYNPQKDIIFFKDKTKGNLRRADKSVFFVFFPDDVHKPCIRINEGSHIKKLVIKIPFV